MVGIKIKGVKGGLEPQPLLLSPDGRNDINELDHVGDLDNVGVPDKGVEEEGDNERVLKIVGFLELLLNAGSVPDIPMLLRAKGGILLVKLYLRMRKWGIRVAGM